MSKAAELLKDYARPIKDIALKCGYSDVSNFYRDFKNFHAVTPKELRFNAPARVERYVENFTPDFPQQSC
jgi:AraC-like DNA-binding protein